ncbi:hypothetical protein ACEPAF_2594 [Sanghuangporus sanghuang]
MATIVARRVRLPRSTLRYLSSRNFTCSAPVLKKRRPTSSLDTDDLFGSVSTKEGDLFHSSFDLQDTPKSSKAASSFQEPKPRRSKVKPQYEQFDEHYAFLMDRLGPKPVAVHPQVRNRAIKRLLHHSRGPEHLERIMEVLAKWRNDGRTVDEQTAVEIIDRFVAWQPTLLLRLLTERPKYGVTLPNVAEARRILRRLVFYRPPEIAGTPDIEAKKKANAEALKNSVTFAALLPAHGFPKAATEDEVCCALLAQACARNLVFAEALERKKAESGTADAKSTSASIPPAKRAPLGTASTRGLLAISSSLATLLSQSSKAQPLSDPETRPDSESELDAEATALLKRMSGVTQTPSDERSWISVSLRDVVRALRDVRASNPSLGSAKTNLEVLDKAFGDLNAGKASLV